MRIERKRSIRTIALVACLVVGLSPSTSAQEACTWEIGVMGALSGDYADWGQPILDGIELAVQEANEAAQLVCQLEVVAQDSQGDPNQAPPLARELANRERLVACLCGFFSGETLATGQIFDRAGILMASTGTHPAVDDQGFGTWFRAVANDLDAATRAAIYLKRVVRPRKIVLARDMQDYPRRVTRQLREKLDWRVKRVVVVDESETDYSRQVEQVRAAAPDLVIYAGYTPQAGRLLKQLRRAGVRSTFMATNSILDPFFDEAAGGDNARGALGMCSCSYAEALGGPATEFAERFEARYSRPPGSYAGDMYDVMNIVTRVLASQTAISPIQTIRDSIVEHFDAAEREPGVIKPYTWERDGELRARGRHVFIFKHGRERWRMLGSVYDLVRS